MHHFLVQHWAQFEVLGKAHNVVPEYFAAIYALHYALLWPTSLWIVIAFRKKQDVSTLIAFWLFFLILPWFYPLFFGILPWWFKAGLIAVMAFIVWHGYHKIQNKLKAEKNVGESSGSEPKMMVATAEVAAEESA